MTNSEYLGATPEPGPEQPRHRSLPRRRRLGRTLLFLFVLALFCATVLSLSIGSGNVTMDLNGEPLNAMQAFVLVVAGVIIAALAVAFGVVTAGLVVLSVILLLLFILLLTVGSLLLALVPVWLPLVLVVAIVVWLARR